MIRYDTGCYNSNMCNTVRPLDVSSMKMGPVSMAVAMYVGERLLGCLVAGQLMRKGIARKIQRLAVIVFDVHVMYEVMYECLEDLC